MFNIYQDRTFVDMDSANVGINSIGQRFSVGEPGRTSVLIIMVTLYYRATIVNSLYGAGLEQYAVFIVFINHWRRRKHLGI